MVDNERLGHAIVRSLRWIIAGVTGGVVIYFATTPGARGYSGLATVVMLVIGIGLEYFVLGFDPSYDSGDEDGE